MQPVPKTALLVILQARALILHRYGGIYTDLDSEALRPMEQLLQGKEVVLGRMGYDLQSQQSIPNAFMASLPDQHFWLYFLKVIEQVNSRYLAISVGASREVHCHVFRSPNMR